ncbi:MAG: phage tail protein [Gemmatimonadales bacterium]
MDANGSRFWMLADVYRPRSATAPRDAPRPFADWVYVASPSHLEFDERHRVLRLASERAAPGIPLGDVTAAVAEDRLALVPQARDALGTWARWRSDVRRVVAGGALTGEVPIHAPAGGDPTDLAVGTEGTLHIAEDGAITLVDLRRRWSPRSVSAPDFVAWRLAPDAAGAVWVLDRTNRRLGRVTGRPFPERPSDPHRTDVFRPDPENPDPPQLVVWDRAAWPEDEDPVALAASAGDGLVLLSWGPDGEARLRRLEEQGRLSRATVLEGARFGYSIAFTQPERLAVLVPGLEREALVYPLAEWVPTTRALGDLYPLRDWAGEPFVHRLAMPPFYPSAREQLALSPVSFPAFSLRGEVRNQQLIDSGDPHTVWHRLYLEAALPGGCGVQVFLAATSDGAAPPASASGAWHEHRFGSVPGQNTGAPSGAWMPFPSEIPFHEGLLDCPREKHRRGLFTALIQRANRRVRSLRGRYLWVRMVLHGDGHATPEVAALRVYAPRFSYVQRYFPELYHESVFGPDADEQVPSDTHISATGADFLERFVASLEGMLTPIEDRIAHAYLLTEPRTAPDDALDWLAGWIGLSFDPSFPPERRRAILVAAPELYRWRGTLTGLRRAIDVVTGGACAQGDAVVVEDFRLRRTFATILGADFADEGDPLLAGFAVSGNSYVGDTLFLGDELRRELLALFAAEDLSAQESAEVRAFFDRLASRVTVLVHSAREPRALGLIERVVELEAPAHIAARVVPARHPFLVGIAALVGADTFLGPAPVARAVRVGESAIGVEDFIQRAPSLDPRLGGEPA